MKTLFKVLPPTMPNFARFEKEVTNRKWQNKQTLKLTTRESEEQFTTKHPGKG